MNISVGFDSFCFKKAFSDQGATTHKKESLLNFAMSRRMRNRMSGGVGGVPGNRAPTSIHFVMPRLACVFLEK